MPGIPARFQSLFWSAPVDQLDLQKHKRYIIHQVLHYGDVDDFFWLNTQYSLDEIRDVFLRYPQRMYTKRSWFFVSKYLLKLDPETIDEEQYVRNFS